jgi:hypothetical protein
MDATVDEYMVELRKSLDNLGIALKDDEPYEFDPVGAIEIEEHQHDVGVKEARAAMDDLAMYDDAMNDVTHNHTMDDLAVDTDPTLHLSTTIDPPARDSKVQD